jgi:bifunctional non-homologous end joining protein LigD
MSPSEKRLAIEVPDHPVSYIDFEGIIPEGEYGAGPVVVWDRGSYELLESGEPHAQLKTGKLAFILKGKKLRGAFALARFAGGRTGNEWLLMKKKDEYADPAWTLKSDLTPARLRQLRVKTPPCETS